MIETIKVSSRGQIVIPEVIRKHMQIKKGTKLVLLERNKRLIIETEKTFLEHIEENKEKKGWSLLAEKNIKKMWDNSEDDDVWTRYL
jgi:AbrB family looped-hinge helix DNA binding protein